jgi:hemerythrin-like metal-binding protein
VSNLTKFENLGGHVPNIVWSDTLSIENAEIDAEHKQLIRIANSLLRAMQEGRNKNDFAKILHELREYTVFHFTNEEVYMRSIEYPDLNKHMEEHNILKRRVKDFQHSVFIGEKVEFDRLREMLKDWLVGHILNCDLLIKEYLASKDVKQEGQA